jgi:hypothetical protein
MKTIHYAGDVVLTNDDVADAVVDYASALAKKGSSAELTIPVVLDDGSTSTASMLLGPASQLIAAPAPGAKEAGADPALLAEIAQAIALLGMVSAKPVDAAPMDGVDDYGLD